MRAIPVRLPGPVLIESPVHADARGFFQEIYRRDLFRDLGITDDFVQDNHSRSSRGVVRGMHFQPGMAKLVRCVRGSIFDVLVDIRPGSATFGHWEGYRLDDEAHLQLYCPDGLAHGFCVVSDVADVIYGCSDVYAPELEQGFHHADPAVGIEWPSGVTLAASPRDEAAPPLAVLSIAVG